MKQHLNYSQAVKSLQIRSFFGPYFPVIGVNTGIQSMYGKIRTRKNSVFLTLHAVCWTCFAHWLVVIFMNFTCNNAANLSKVEDKVTETLEWFNCCYSWRLKNITLASNVFIIDLEHVFILIIFTLDMQSFRRLLANWIF